MSADRLPAQPDTSTIDARVVKALAHPTRVRILDLLRDRELISPVEIAEELGLALGTVGYHVRRLEELGFIELAKRTQRRGAIEHHYRARAALDLPRRIAAPQLVSVASRGAEAAEQLREAQDAVARGAFDAVAARSDRVVLELDARGRKQLSRALDEWLATVDQIERESARRLASGNGVQARACTVVVMRFDVPGE